MSRRESGVAHAAAEGTIIGRCGRVTLQGLTAHYLLHEFYPIERGSTVLVHAAAGGMGLLLVQRLKHVGAVAIGTVSTEEKAKAARAAGADHVILKA
jgi:NADPH2:quinone reductase